MIYCILLLLFSALCCGGMEIIRNGVPCAEIVIDKKAHTEIRFAAEELRLHLRKISGASLPVTTKSSGRFPVKICVGESPEAKAAGYQLPRWDGSGYDIWIRGGTVVLNGPLTLHTEEAGNRHPLKTSPVSENIRNPELSVSAANDNGPMHAVSAFLERLGVRFYAPYEGGTVYPCLKTVAVQEGRETRTAAFSRREYQFGIVQADDAEGIRWLKRLKSGSGLPAPCTIRLADILAGQETKHPEWFSLDEKGVPLKSEEGCGVPRYTHPGLQRKCIEEIRKFLDRNPAAKTLEVQEPHSQTLFTDWRDLKAWKRLDLFPSNNPASDIYFHFLSVLAGKIAESHPDRKLIWKLPKPQKLMEDKLLVIKRTASLSAMPPALPAGSYASEKNRQSMLDLYERLYNAFRKEKMQQREWWNDYVSAEIPPQINFFAHAIQQMRRSQRLFLDGFLMDVAADREQKRIAEAPLAHLMLYINSKLLWDPDLDMDSLLDEYYRFRFGPAAGEMKTFFRFAEHVCAREKSRSISENGGQLTPNDIPVWFELLKQAKSKTEKGSVYAKRIESLEEKTAWMKSVFRHRTPAGAMLRGDVLPHKAKCDLDLAKYTNWQTLDHGADCSQPEERTEFAVAATENGSKLFAAFRCYRKDMPRQQNDPAFPSGDSVRLLACTPQTAWICITADASGNASAQMLDPKILFQAWQPSDRKLEIHTKVRYYSDRWELEFSVSLAGWGRFPNWHPPWGINAVRTRRSGEGEKSVSAVPDRWSGPVPHMELWRRFYLEKRDAHGRPVNELNSVEFRLPGYSDDIVYKIGKASGKVDPAAAWDSPCWRDVRELRLGNVLWFAGKSSDFYPDARAKLQYDDKYLYVLYQVRDRYVRGYFKKDQNMVCLDSCMELFIRPEGKGSYFNFETNCIGTLLLYEIDWKGSTQMTVPLTQEELRTVKRFPSLHSVEREITEPVTWRLCVQIPLEIFVRRRNIRLPLSGQVWTGNIMKCANGSSHPAWLTWKKAKTFHAPQDFGVFIFE